MKSNLAAVSYTVSFSDIVVSMLVDSSGVMEELCEAACDSMGLHGRDGLFS